MTPPETRDPVETQLASAVRRDVLDVELPDFASMTASARRRGGRLRLRRRGGVVAASLAVVTVVAGIAWAGTTHPTAGVGVPTFADQPAPAPAPLPVVRQVPRPTHHHRGTVPGAVAVLDAPRWTCPDPAGARDEKLYYVDGDSGVSLNWRPADDYGPKYTSGPVLANTTIGGDPAQVLDSDGMVLVVGPVRDGTFLTLSGTADLTADQLADLATHVVRQ